MRLRPQYWSAFAFAGLLLLAGTAVHAQLGRELSLTTGTVTDSLTVDSVRPATLPTGEGFALAQLRNERVLGARVETRFEIKRLFHEKGIRYPAARIFVRIFKRERSLELWVQPDGEATFSLLKTYPICALAGDLGPKRQQGDAQVPEGFYTIDFFNPVSDYHLSLHVNYPNQRDRLTSAGDVDLGGDIFIHGGCSSEGCLALTDDGIKELYWIAVEARAVGQAFIPVHIFPARLEDQDLRLLQDAFADQPQLGEFWQSLKPGYDYFEEHRRMPVVSVDATGSYLVNGAAAVPALGTPLDSPVGAPLGVQLVRPDSVAGADAAVKADTTALGTGRKPLGKVIGGQRRP